MAYLVNSINPVIEIDNDEITDYGWFEVEDFQSLSWISEAMKELAKKAVTNYDV